MKSFIKEYLKIIAFSVIGFVFVLSSFYFVMNYYHFEEVKKQVYIDQNDAKLITYKNTVDKINDNLVSYQKKNIMNSSYQKIYSTLYVCHSSLTDNYYNMETNRYYGANDIYKMGNDFYSNVLNTCWALHVSSLNESDIKKFRNVYPFIENEINGISNQTSNALNEIMNNSSYYYSTRTTSVTIRDNLLSDYNVVANSYQEFANIILNLSELLNEGGNND